MKVLLTNDDGIHARGLMALYTALCERGHDVTVVAPMQQQSGVGHSLTVYKPLQAVRFSQPGFQGLGVYGTPTDCVKLALGNLLPEPPDLVMSGINAGPNVGPDILYSGTVGAATEACHEDLASMAVSDDEDDPVDLLGKARHAVALAETLDWASMPRRRVINVNYPRGPLAESRGVRVCPQTTAVWKNSYLERRDPRGARYWWLVGEVPAKDVNPGSDKALLGEGYVTVTPLCFAFTDEAGLEVLQRTPLPDPAGR
ncbi:MAG: 5'/3'-nucleotidase SurE [Desulfovibrionaceae bacterium]|nr:5'/3'-nucleotidase SurE [Desulfovibrionaceae bacterium]